MSELRWSHRACAFCGDMADAWSDYTVRGAVEHLGMRYDTIDAYPICRECQKRPAKVLEAIAAAGFTPPD